MSMKPTTLNKVQTAAAVVILAVFPLMLAVTLGIMLDAHFFLRKCDKEHRAHQERMRQADRDKQGGEEP